MVLVEVDGGTDVVWAVEELPVSGVDVCHGSEHDASKKHARSMRIYDFMWEDNKEI